MGSDSLFKHHWVSTFLMAALFASGCVGSGGLKQAQTEWNRFELKTFSAQTTWNDGKKDYSGYVAYSRPLILKMAVTDKGFLAFRPPNLWLVNSAWWGGLFIRNLPAFSDKAIVALLGHIIENIERNYDRRSEEGPLIAGRKTRVYTLKPTSKPKTPGIHGITLETERYWLDAEDGFPLRYALINPQGKELYHWELSKLKLDRRISPMTFFYFPPKNWYNNSVSAPVEASSGGMTVPEVGLENARSALGYSLFKLGSPLKLQAVTLHENKPMSSYKSSPSGGLAYLIQMPLVEPELGGAELRRGENWKTLRFERFNKQQVLGPFGLGLHQVRVGDRTLGYDNFFGFKVFGWREEGMALTLVTTLDYRQALVAIDSGSFQ